ncbi:MAG TPA: polysaccharide biosynthesis tyrosine autokinase [Arenimonas sp.]|uniref:GumC family protein n=1 Tax=Arenimonas sp. TaxID=1872635 RepID=UPI002B5A1EF3|nr:polysaccharide biosynthesis tyrosine autokinase [Arenimonas sp.]HMB56848.1 polysaccharide biosynthesis tyrosine autokinase [Arenimonas sp.]
MQKNQSDDDGHRRPANLPTAAHDRQQALTFPVHGRPQPLSLDVLPQADKEGTGDEIDLLSYWRILVKRRWTVLGALAIVLVTTLVGTLLMTPIYRASASLQIDRDTIKVVDVQGMEPIEGSGDRDFYQTQYELLQSRALAERVVSQLNLAQTGELERISPHSPWAKLMSMLSGNGGDAGKNGRSGETAAQKDTRVEDRQRALVSAFADGLSIEPVRNSRLVRVNYDSPDKRFSQRAANAVAEAFIASNLERRFDSSSYAKGYLEDRLQELKLKLEDSERKLVGFAQKEQIVSTGGEQSGSLSEQTLGTLNAALGKAKEDRIRAESRWRQAQASRGLVMFGDAGSNSIIQSLQQNRATLMADYQDKLRLYKPAYPLMQQLKGQIDEVDKQIAGEMGNIRSSIQAEYLAAQEQERLLNEQMTNVKGEVLDLQNRSIQYNIYKREVDTNRQLYDGLLQRYKEIGIAGGVSTNNISIVDKADIGSKYKPSLTRNLALGGLVGLMLGVLLALGFEYLDDTLKTPEDLEKQLGLAVLGVIPKLKDITPERALLDSRSAFAEAYRSVRTALQFSTAHGSPKTLLITSATPNEGKSTTALTLARNFAQLGKRVLLIDADLRNPSQHKILNVSNTKGLSNLLAGAAKPMDVIIETGEPNLQIMTSGPLPPNPAELLSGSKLLSLLTVAAEKFDKIIIDGPPVLGLADAPILSNVAHATLLVVEAGETRIGVARNAIKRLQAARAFVVGGLLTKYESKQAGRGYGYGYGDYSYYSYGGKEQAKLTER